MSETEKQAAKDALIKAAAKDRLSKIGSEIYSMLAVVLGIIAIS